MIRSQPLSPASNPLPFGDKPTLDPTPREPSGLPHPGSGSTLPLGMDLMAQVRQALPFAKSAGATPPSSTPAQLSPAPPPPSTPGQAPSSGPAPPASLAPIASPSRMTLQTYASLCAELAYYPANRGAILARYGITDDAEHRSIEREWQSRLADPESRSKWQQLYTTYSDWLRNKQAR